MREIKFRVWDRCKKKMLSWEQQKDHYHQFLVGLMDDPKTVEEEPDGYDLMQYTGLKDCNGKDVYEGDVLKDDEGMLLEVKFGKLPLNKSGDCVCAYEAFYAKCYGKLGQAPYYECQEIGEWMEVIGNIYENPELLGVTE